MSYDAEKIVADYLREEIGARVVAKPPDNRDTAWVQLVEIDAPQASNSQTYHFVHHYLQLDCYAGRDGGPPEAKAVADQVCDALVALEGTQDGAVVSFARIDGNHRDWDTAMTPARDRRTITATVGMHP